MYVLLGRGDGTFGTSVAYDVGNSMNARPASVAIGDLNGDGKADIITANSGFDPFAVGSVSVLLGNGDGTFQPQVSYATAYGSNFVALGDFNGDRKMDLAVTNNDCVCLGTLGVLLCMGDGSFMPMVTYVTGWARRRWRSAISTATVGQISS